MHGKTAPDDRRNTMTLADEHRRELQALDEVECHRLLAGASLGRLAFTEGALPAIEPVSFVVSDREVVIPTRVGSKVAAAAHGAIVAFEVDDVDVAERTGWNVTVVGPARVISAPAAVAVLDALGARAWAPADVPCYVAVTIAVIRGRRLVAAPSPARSAAAASARGP